VEKKKDSQNCELDETNTRLQACVRPFYSYYRAARWQRVLVMPAIIINAAACVSQPAM